MATKVVLQNVRFAFPTLAEAQAHPSDQSPNPKRYYSLNAIMPKDHPQIAEIQAAQLEAIAAKFTNGDLNKAKPILAAAQGIGKVALHDGDLKDQYDGYPGNLYISARTEASKARPLVYGLGGKAAGAVEPTVIYGGCYGRVVLNFFAYGGVKGVPRGVSAGLGDVQFLRDGDSFGAGAPRATEDDFGSIDAPDNDPLMA